jgi:hypothetical protein
MAVVVLVGVIGIIVTRGQGSGTNAAPGAAGTPVAGPAVPGSCHSNGQLPDPVCTPGVPDPAVTAANLYTTICRGGWSRKVRPPASYTDDLKRRQLQAYGLTGSLSQYEEDHLIPISLGGSPTDPRNLWPQPGASPNPKDRVEAAAARAVCSSRMPLASTQKAMASDWVALGRQLGVSP